LGDAFGRHHVLGSLKGRWLRGTEFYFPERPANLPSSKPLDRAKWFARSKILSGQIEFIDRLEKEVT